MSNQTADIQNILADQDPEFRQWAEEHRQCEHRLHELTTKSDITNDEEIEEKHLKKRKLHLKDQMAERMRSYEAGQHAVA
ncbi:MAG: YdcH family protein [Acidobacteria bacterium]|nr:YdcH family protein [Acidobacteriota bacterium]MBV9476580.1 YdcH family protein [Acidobacteriota bacterium]